MLRRAIPRITLNDLALLPALIPFSIGFGYAVESYAVAVSEACGEPWEMVVAGIAGAFGGRSTSVKAAFVGRVLHLCLSGIIIAAAMWSLCVSGIAVARRVALAMPFGPLLSMLIVPWLASIDLDIAVARSLVSQSLLPALFAIGLVWLGVVWSRRPAAHNRAAGHGRARSRWRRQASAFGLFVFVLVAVHGWCLMVAFRSGWIAARDYWESL